MTDYLRFLNALYTTYGVAFEPDYWRWEDDE